MAAEPTRHRKSPETRLAPLPMLVLDPPLPLPDEYASGWTTARPRPDEGKLDERRTPLAREMVEGVPADGAWYLAAICYSRGQANALASHIWRGGYGANVKVAYGPVPNKNRRGSGREHAVLLRRRKR